MEADRGKGRRGSTMPNDIKPQNKFSLEFSNGFGSLEVIYNLGESIFSRHFGERSDGTRFKE